MRCVAFWVAQAQRWDSARLSGGPWNGLSYSLKEFLESSAGREGVFPFETLSYLMRVLTLA